MEKAAQDLQNFEMSSQPEPVQSFDEHMDMEMDTNELGLL